MRTLPVLRVDASNVISFSLLSSSSLSSSHGLSSSSLIEYYKVMTTTVSEM